jgi:hypothetical protein
MLRIFLFGLAKRRKQPERYVPFALKFVGNILTKIKDYDMLVSKWRIKG